MLTFDVFTTQQRMNTLRKEAEDANERANELQEHIKFLKEKEVENTQELEALQRARVHHETVIDELNEQLRESKNGQTPVDVATDNQNLTRRVETLEEEVEKTDEALRSANDKCVALSLTDGYFGHVCSFYYLVPFSSIADLHLQFEKTAFVQPTSNVSSSSVKSRLEMTRFTGAKPNMKTCRRNSTTLRNHWRSWKPPWLTTELLLLPFWLYQA